MTRKEAQTWISIPKEKIKIVAPHIYKNFDVVAAYANGAEVECFDGKWNLEPHPSFCEHFDYRVKPSEKPDEESYETWKPKLYQGYYFVNGYGEIDSIKNNEVSEDDERFSFGNFFKTYKDAKIAIDMIRDAISNSKETKNKSYKNWMPGYNQGYYFISSYGEIEFAINTGHTEDDGLFEFGNFFKTVEDAKVASHMIREAIVNSKKVMDQELKHNQMGPVEAA